MKSYMYELFCWKKGKILDGAKATGSQPFPDVTCEEVG